jgi:hypothetical protein
MMDGTMRYCTLATRLLSKLSSDSLETSSTASSVTWKTVPCSMPSVKVLGDVGPHRVVFD